MEQVKKVMQDMGLEVSQQKVTSAGQQQLQRILSNAEKNKANLEQIALVVGEVELAKQIHLSDEERAVLQSDLFALGETIQELRARAEYVKRSTTYGKLSLDLWMKAEPLYTMSEINEILELKIAKRRQTYIEKAGGFVDSKELAEQGLIELQQYWIQEARRMIELHYGRLESRCKKLRAQFFHLPQQAKNDLWTKAVQKGIVKDGDAHAMLILPQLIPQLIEETEELIKNNSINLNH